MSASKTIDSRAFDDAPIEQDTAERQLALEYVADAWNMAEDEGVDPLALAHASLFAALVTFVSQHGEDAAIKLAEGLPARIDAGEYTLDRTLQ